MSIHIGTFERAVGDDYSVSINFAAPDVFTASPLTALTLTTATPPSGVTAPTLGTPVYTTSNEPAFRISGGTVGDVLVTASATNAASPPAVVTRTFTIKTR